MESVSVNKFRENLKEFVDKVSTNHDPLKVTRRNGVDFVVLSAEDWERDRETLNILQNSELMKQIEESIKTHKTRTGFIPDQEQLDEINRI